MKFLIGYERDTYAEQRLFINKCNLAKYIKLTSIDNPKYPEFFDQNERFNSSWIDYSGNKLDLIHYFNQINFGDVPFVVTYETIAPRFWNKISFNKGVDILLSDKCIQIIAMSKSCFDIQQGALKSLSDSDKKLLLDKTCILHPPQELLPNRIDRFDNISCLKLIFVGRDFINKGGIPMLKALKNMVSRDYPIKLYLVSSLNIIDNTTNSTQQDVEWVKAFILDNSDWIVHYHSLPNYQVLSLLSECHLGLLPTLAETYGYSVLEMQAAGVPVISTNIRALSEINKINWLISLPYTMRPIIRDENSIPSLYWDVQLQLERVLEDIFADLNILKFHSVKSQERIAKEHNLLKYSDALNCIYSKSL